jgi:hypothetical protein
MICCHYLLKKRLQLIRPRYLHSQICILISQHVLGFRSVEGCTSYFDAPLVGPWPDMMTCTENPVSRLFPFNEENMYLSFLQAPSLLQQPNHRTIPEGAGGTVDFDFFYIYFWRLLQTVYVISFWDVDKDLTRFNWWQWMMLGSSAHVHHMHAVRSRIDRSMCWQQDAGLQASLNGGSVCCSLDQSW